MASKYGKKMPDVCTRCSYFIKFDCYLSKKGGGKKTFWGGCQPLHLLTPPLCMPSTISSAGLPASTRSVLALTPPEIFGGNSGRIYKYCLPAVSVYRKTGSSCRTWRSGSKALCAACIWSVTSDRIIGCSGWAWPDHRWIWCKWRWWRWWTRWSRRSGRPSRRASSFDWVLWIPWAGCSWGARRGPCAGTVRL